VLVIGQVLSVLALLFATYDFAVWMFVILFGVSNGLLTLARPLVVADWNGTANFGATSGRLAGWSQGARAVAPALASALHAVNDSYRGVLIALGVFGLSAVVVSLHADKVRDRNR
jgi:hypothetical protein